MKKREIRAVGIDTSFVYQSFLRDSEEKKRLGIPVLEDSLVQEILLWLNKDFQLRSVEWELPYILCNAIALGGYLIADVSNLPKPVLTLDDRKSWESELYRWNFCIDDARSRLKKMFLDVV